MSDNPLNIAVLQVPEEGVAVEAEVAAAALDLPEDERIRVTQPVRVSLKVERRNRDVTARGRLAATLSCRCDRCLDPFEQALEVLEVCHFWEDVQEDWIDLTPALREDIVLALPNQLLCRDVCSGLCPVCGQNRNRAHCTCLEEADGAEDAWGELNKLDLPDNEPPEDQRG